MADVPHPQYAVTGQQFGIEPTGTGGYQDTATVHFVTASGDAAHVKIPMTHYTARNVHDAIQAQATRMEQVRSLGNGPPPPAENPA
jgi:hypothetical protein